MTALALLVPGFVVQPACVPAVRPSAPRSAAEVVHVSAPTGNRVAHRASILEAVRDLGSGNRVSGLVPPGADIYAPAVASANAAGWPVREGYAPGADGVLLFYRIEGSGADTIVVLHGGPSLGLAYLAPDLDGLGREYTLLHYDQRGVGRSTLPAAGVDLTIDRHVADLDALRDHFGLHRLVLIGHSWGGMLAAHYAATHPQWVERMLFIDPMAPAAARYMATASANAQQLMQERLDDNQRSRVDSLYRSWANAEDPTAHCRTVFALLMRVYFQESDGVERARGDFCAGSADVLRSRPQVDAAILGALGDWDVRPLLLDVEVPVLIMHGAESAIPLDAMRAWTEAFPNARLLIVPDAGHYLHVDRPDMFFPAAAEFLGGTWPAAAFDSQFGAGAMHGAPRGQVLPLRSPVHADSDLKWLHALADRARAAR